MTKKRFHKLLRAWFVKGETRKATSKVTWKLCMRALNDYKSVDRMVAGAKPYAEIWAAITNNGTMTLGVGEKEKCKE